MQNNTPPPKGPVGYPTTPQPQAPHPKPLAQAQTIQNRPVTAYQGQPVQAQVGVQVQGQVQAQVPGQQSQVQQGQLPTATPVVGGTPVAAPVGATAPAGVPTGAPGLGVATGAPVAAGQQPEENEVITRKKLQELVGQISSGEVLDAEVEEVLLEVVDDFIDSVTTFACSLAKHRNSTTLEVRDLMTHLERNWNIKIPGYGNAENSRPFKRQMGSDGHKTRLALVKKSAAAPPPKQPKLQ